MDKSDVIAKKRYAERLKDQGFSDVRIISSPADICAK
jgi:hypothetical protein